MEITYFLPMEFNLLSSLFYIVTPLFLLFISSKYFTSNKNLPPGPRPFPIIGNLHQMSKKPHIDVAMFAQKYGPVISLRLGSQELVVASSKEAAIEVLKTQDRHLSGRITPDAISHSFKDFYLVWAHDCDEYWKSLRRLCKTDMFSVKAIEAQSYLRSVKLAEMLDYLKTKQGKVVKIEQVVFTTLFNTMSNIVFSKDFLDLKDDHGTAHWLKLALTKTLENSMTPNISDLFPVLAGLDLQGLRRDNLKHFNEVASFTESIIKERRDRIASSTVVTRETDFLDHLLENNYTNAQINILALEMFIAGTDTVVSTIEWLMAELLKNKEIMNRVENELKTEINSKSIMQADFSKLTYFNACIKEVFRLHPVVPLLIPRRAVETCELMNYTIHKNSQIWVNVWAIGRDPKVWEDPNTFKPERFLGSHLDYTGHDYELMPFGGGRRMCPGLPSGIKGLHTILASLILEFNWALPNGEDPSKLDMNEKFGVTLQKEKPLELIFTCKE